MKITSSVYDSEGNLLGNFFHENRVLVTYKELPKDLINALISREDIRFREHSGIDIKALFRAVLLLGTNGGGSTISQQLAKLIFTGVPSKNKFRRLHQKIFEWVLSIELEKKYTKEEIITIYLNKFDFLYNSKGIEVASRTFFNKSVYELNLTECATLVGMLENPLLYNPSVYPEIGWKKRNTVLSQMRKYKFINELTYRKAVKQPTDIKFKVDKKYFELKTYYADFLKKEVEEALNEYRKETGETLNLYFSGLKIYISINSKMQGYAENAAEKHLTSLQSIFDNLNGKKYKRPLSRIFLNENHSKFARLQFYQDSKNRITNKNKIIKKSEKIEYFKKFTWKKFKNTLIPPLLDLIKYQRDIIQVGMISIEPHTGFIRAWVGGVNFENQQYDHVYQAKRQIGSTFKPFVYATAINQFHYNPCTIISNERFTFSKWSPRNVDNKYGGFLTLKESLERSVNIISARLISIITPHYVIDLTNSMNIKSHIPENYSISLGSADLNPYEINGAFNTFNNHGIYIKPTLLIKIENRYGRVIKRNISVVNEVLNEEISYIMIKLMQGVINFGTGRRIRNYGITAEVAGKTGTSNNYVDGWFVGLTPTLTTTVWVGWDNPSIHFKTLSLGQGANMALPIWAYYMLSIYADKKLGYTQNEVFDIPNNLSYYWDNCGFYSNDKKFEIMLRKRNDFFEINEKMNEKDDVNYND